MTINDHIRDKKRQYDINRETTKISALSSGEIHKYEYLTGEEILPSNQQQIIEQAKFTYSPLGKAFKKQVKTIEDQGKNMLKLQKSSKVKKNDQLILMLMKINYYFQKYQKYLKISITKGFIK